MKEAHPFRFVAALLIIVAAALLSATTALAGGGDGSKLTAVAGYGKGTSPSPLHRPYPARSPRR